MLSNIYAFIIGLLLLPTFFAHAHKITIIGTGYVGLVSGACLAHSGNHVICANIDSKKIDNLRNGILPIYEQGLDAIVAQNSASGRLIFTDNVEQAIIDADIIFIAVGTPMSDNGSADLSYINAVVATIARTINSYKVIVTKSTVPVGTGKKIKTMLQETFNVHPDLFSIASNPEFLREGIAVNDFLYPDRIVIGTDSDRAREALYTIYAPLITGNTHYIVTGIHTAEMIKYVTNAFLAMKVSYINEVANLCDAVGANVLTVAHAMGLDHRISPYFLNPGPGFGGSCFPKDAQALIYMADNNNVNAYMTQSALKANEAQQKKPVEKLIKLMSEQYNQNIAGKNITVLGLAFKANTDDIRYSPAITTIKLLQKNGAHITAYDPIAMHNMHHLFPDITYSTTLYNAATDADAIIIMTDWDEIKQMDLAHIKSIMNQPIIIDARNSIDPAKLKQHGFFCDNIGQSCLCSS